MLTSQLSRKGQITLPKHVRAAMGIQPGDFIATGRGPTGALRRIEPFDAAFYAGLFRILDEWATPEDEAGFGDLA